MSDSFGSPVAFFVLRPLWDWADAWRYAHAELLADCERNLDIAVDQIAKRQEAARR